MMTMHATLRRGLLALAVAALAPAASATTSMVLVDSVTELKIDWNWDGAIGSYAGTHWNAWIKPLDTGGTWFVEVSYQHLDGPHAELAERAEHAVPTVIVAPGGSSFTNGVDPHYLPTLHLNAHPWDLAVWAAPLDQQGQATGGFAAFQVQHVPEPGTWLLFGAGLALVGWGARRRA